MPLQVVITVILECWKIEEATRPQPSRHHYFGARFPGFCGPNLQPLFPHLGAGSRF